MTQLFPPCPYLVLLLLQFVAVVISRSLKQMIDIVGSIQRMQEGTRGSSTRSSQENSSANMIKEGFFHPTLRKLCVLAKTAVEQSRAAGKRAQLDSFYETLMVTIEERLIESENSGW